jgi:hypothetical protein
MTVTGSSSKSRFVMIRRLAWALCAVSVSPAMGQSPEKGQQYVDVTLERLENESWRAVDPRTVLSPGDRIRFQAAASFPGFLYVFYQGSAGESGWLYPGREAANRLEPGQTFQVPPDKGFYSVGGPPGFDSTFWIVTPAPLGDNLGDAPAVPPGAANTLVPRCREVEPKATRSSCLDDRAGPRKAENPERILPRAASGMTLRPRELTFGTVGGNARVQAVEENSAPFIYELRIAHR